MPSWVLQSRRDFYERFAGGERCLECFNGDSLDDLHSAGNALEANHGVQTSRDVTG